MCSEHFAPETPCSAFLKYLVWTCRSFLPPRAKFGDPRLNSNLRFPQIACIISPHPWFSFFYKVLSNHSLRCSL